MANLFPCAKCREINHQTKITAQDHLKPPSPQFPEFPFTWNWGQIVLHHLQHFGGTQTKVIDWQTIPLQNTPKSQNV